MIDYECLIEDGKIYFFRSVRSIDFFSLSVLFMDIKSVSSTSGMSISSKRRGMISYGDRMTAKSISPRRSSFFSSRAPCSRGAGIP